MNKDIGNIKIKNLDKFRVFFTLTLINFQTNTMISLL